MTNNTEIYQLYLHELHAQSLRMLKVLCLIGLCMHPAFGIVDYLLEYDNFRLFMTIRIVVFFLALATYLILRTKFGERNQYYFGIFLIFVFCASLVLMILHSVNYKLSYYEGMVLVLIAFSLFMPWETKYTVYASALIYLFYVAASFYIAVKWNYQTFFVYNFYLLSVITLAVISSFFTNKIRFSIFKSRHDLAASNRSLEEAKEDLLEANKYMSIYNEELYGDLEQKNIKLIELNKIKDEFLAKTSHELKAPLAGMVGIAESTIPAASAGMVDTVNSNLWLILSSGRRLMNLVNDVLDFVRLRYRDIQLYKRRVDLSLLVDLIYEFSTPLIQGKQIALNNRVRPGSFLLFADENRLQQILFNLVGNAIKFSERGEVTVSAAPLEDMPFVQITVSDTGPGIPKDRLGSIFNSYETSETGVDPRHEGMGLGLSITKHLVELHGGTIRVESNEGQGANFIFTLPAYAEANQSKQTEEPEDLILTKYEKVVFGRARISELNGDRGNILVLDDEPMNLLVVRSMLEGKGYSAAFINDPTSAVETIMKKKYDLVVLDVMMPEMTGYEVCRAIRERWPLHELPIILLTVRSDSSDVIAGFEAGANDYLIKPIRTEEFLARVDTLVRLTQTARSHNALEYKLLQEKMNPHFLFNMLNIIYSHIVRGSNVADRLVLKLADIYKFLINRSCQPLIPFVEEWQFVKDYLEVQSYLFSDALTLHLHQEGDFSDVMIPPLTIQPIVENCIKHGFCNRRDNACIEVRAQRSGTEVRVEVYDNGEGLTKDVVHYSSLENIRKRLMLNFKEVELSVVNRDGGGVRALAFFKLSSA